MVIARLFAKLIRKPESDCWLWTGMVNQRKYNKAGYGKIRADGKMVSVHRYVYEYINGVKLPRDVQIRHKCDNPVCCNPGHLDTGSNAQNIQDKIDRDRSGKKLRIADAVEVKKMIAQGLSQKAVADHFGLAQSTVSRIVAGIRWAHLNESTKAEQASCTE